jgi:hypothetical protein
LKFHCEKLCFIYRKAGEVAEALTDEQFCSSSETVNVDMSECSHSFREPAVDHDEMDHKHSPRSSPSGWTSIWTLNTTNRAEFCTEFGQHSDSAGTNTFQALW